MKSAGRTGLFPLYKLGPEFPRYRFMDKDGSNLQVKFGKWQELMFEPHLYARAKKHADWKKETSSQNQEEVDIDDSTGS